MKILAVADEECPALWDFYTPDRLAGVDLILSCGDLKADYLSFLVTMGRAPVLYVHGNHDTSYGVFPPEGCDCIEDTVTQIGGVRILGLGGCLRYHPGDWQFTEREMQRRIRKLGGSLRRHGGVDIVVAHAPPAGLGDADDPAHRGFACFVELIDRWQPRYFLHGHVHPYYNHNRVRIHTRAQTQIINVGQRTVLDIPEW